MTRLGYQIPNFDYPGVAPSGIFDAVVAQAKAAEASGFDRVFVMDHFYQLPGIGDPDANMFECYTLLAALAQHTQKVRLSALVTGNTYRNPAVLAKTITALDHVSHGRATLGIGSGWFELEHDSFGIPFNTFSERFEKLEEALNIILPMLRGERPSLDGKHYTVSDAINEPLPLSKIPMMIGGSGEKKTLRMVAQYADESNLTCSVEEIPRKLEALDAHCERLGRDRSEIKVTKLVMMAIGETHDQCVADLKAFAEFKGWPESVVDMMTGMLTYGGPDEVAEQVREMIDAGLDGVTVNLVSNGHNPEMVELAGRTLDAAIG
ncbi:MAG: putative luciferase-like oxidoreductase [Acidimicrobiales bacterium]|nr:MAG: putative luciferase-like oxidoreductase [Acidimicrobiales bacterium]